MVDEENTKTDLKKEIEQSAKLFDVAKPGKTPPSATSRPIIVGHNSMMKQDPMVKAAVEEGAENSSRPPLKSRAASKSITPDVKKPDEPPANKEPDAPAEEPEELTDSADQPQNDNAAAVNAVASEVTAKREEEKALEEEQAKIDEVEKSIEKREFFVPIGQESRRRSTDRILLAIILLIILLGVGLNFAADAGLIDIGIDPFTDLL